MLLSLMETTEEIILRISIPSGDFDVVEEGDRFGVIKDDHFVALTNFAFKFLCKVVPPPELKQFNGFLVEVATRAGRNRNTG